MKGFGKLLMGLGAAVGAAIAIALIAHLGIAGAPWLVNVALAKLGLMASGGLMAGGAATVRLAVRRERANLLRSTSEAHAEHPPGPR
jgi:hypothetical protein